jgi:hypothetical protein
VAAGSDDVSETLRRCLLWAGIVLERQVLTHHCAADMFHVDMFYADMCLTRVSSRKGEMPEAFRPKYEVLIGIRNELDKLSITPAWSLREADLYDFQRQLDRIDESRVDGNWLDDDGKPAELYVQRVCHTVRFPASLRFD